MQTDAVFENIAERIQTEIGKTKHTLLIAVAWFTNKNIFNAILAKAKEGCNVSLIISDDEINANSRIDFSELEKHNGRFYKFGDGDTELMHNKFCVIDNSTVITGSYNWSYKAENNFENIVINYEDTFLAEQFINEFKSLLQKLGVENYSKTNQSESSFIDTELIALKLEVRLLENKLNAFNNEKIELEKVLADFQHNYNIELGELLLEILRLRKVKFANDKDKSEEAENDFKEFNESFEKEKKKTLNELTDEEKIELKNKFRKASHICHPDKVNDELKDIAAKIFIDLKNANDSNDLKKVSEILKDLEAGDFFKQKSETITEKDKLKAYVAQLKMQIKQIEEERLSIVRSETYQLIISIKDLATYFNEMKDKLNKELTELENEIPKIDIHKTVSMETISARMQGETYWVQHEYKIAELKQLKDPNINKDEAGGKMGILLNRKPDNDLSGEEMMWLKKQLAYYVANTDSFKIMLLSNMKSIFLTSFNSKDGGIKTRIAGIRPENFLTTRLISDERTIDYLKQMSIDAGYLMSAEMVSINGSYNYDEYAANSIYHYMKEIAETFKHVEKRF